jgi:hypothetical protein
MAVMDSTGFEMRSQTFRKRALSIQNLFKKQTLRVSYIPAEAAHPRDAQRG